jgi:TolB protein
MGAPVARRRKIMRWLLVIPSVAARAALRRWRILGSLLSVILLGGLAVATPALATYPGQNGRIAFLRFVETTGQLQLFSVNPDGSDTQQLTDFPDHFAEGPDWSADGTKIAFDSDLAGNVHIFSINADGSGLTQITSGSGFEGFPSWSPDATKIAVDGGDEDGLPQGIFIVDVATGALTPVTANPYGFFDTEPQYSPDGTQITFTRVKRFNPGRGGQTAVFVVNVDGSHLRQLTPWGMNAAESDWSPDGSKIALNDADDRIKTASIYVINPDGTGLTKLTHDTNAGSFRPCWSPAGDRIVFTRISFGPHGGPFDLYTMNADGTNVTPLTQTPDFENQADWGPHP